MQKFYSVRCKCGHVGRGNYIPLDFPIYAESATAAAAIARNKGGVKHHHQDAILAIEEIPYEKFIQIRREYRGDIYWQGARANLAVLADRIQKEPERLIHYENPQKKVAIRIRREKQAITDQEIFDDIAKEYGYCNV
ncbi:hypothetical protein FACS189445_1370 [Spirochaetia bacterium]|nr:hypothetical protein FACS189445_1370 [Spirochaetia bacterium]